MDEATNVTKRGGKKIAIGAGAGIAGGLVLMGALFAQGISGPSRPVPTTAAPSSPASSAVSVTVTSAGSPTSASPSGMPTATPSLAPTASPTVAAPPQTPSPTASASGSDEPRETESDEPRETESDEPRETESDEPRESETTKTRTPKTSTATKTTTSEPPAQDSGVNVVTQLNKGEYVALVTSLGKTRYTAEQAAQVAASKSANGISLEVIDGDADRGLNPGTWAIGASGLGSVTEANQTCTALGLQPGVNCYRRYIWGN